jgi:3-methylfumaryl-CoA hydratase
MAGSDGAGDFTVRVGDRLPVEARSCDEVQLFLYNAVLFNAHRIHFDLPYATEVEQYPGLVVAGPLIGDWLHQCVENWLGEHGRLFRIDYSNRGAAYVGDALEVGGEVTAVDEAAGEATVSLWVRNAAGDVIAPGTATVRLAPAGS